MDFVSRLKKFMEYRQIPITQFADTCNIPRPTISQILNGRNKKISDEIIGKIHAAFPELSVVWLMFGEGSMLTNQNTQFSEGKNSGFSGDSSMQTFNPDPLDGEKINFGYVEKNQSKNSDSQMGNLFSDNIDENLENFGGGENFSGERIGKVYSGEGDENVGVATKAYPIPNPVETISVDPADNPVIGSTFPHSIYGVGVTGGNNQSARQTASVRSGDGLAGNRTMTNNGINYANGLPEAGCAGNAHKEPHDNKYAGLDERNASTFGDIHSTPASRATSRNGVSNEWKTQGNPMKNIPQGEQNFSSGKAPYSGDVSETYGMFNDASASQLVESLSESLSQKRIKSIVVFYEDSTFQTFTPQC